MLYIMRYGFLNEIIPTRLAFDLREYFITLHQRIITSFDKYNDKIRKTFMKMDGSFLCVFFWKNCLEIKEIILRYKDEKQEDEYAA